MHRITGVCKGLLEYARDSWSVHEITKGIASVVSSSIPHNFTVF